MERASSRAYKVHPPFYFILFYFTDIFRCPYSRPTAPGHEKDAPTPPLYSKTKNAPMWACFPCWSAFHLPLQPPPHPLHSLPLPSSHPLPPDTKNVPKWACFSC